ncbi:peptidase C39 family protein [Streptomyces sp. RB6PN25]|uniref:Peptidase C39 family protein n=1 Tax=Streptomyces humicola TaxID=2953240 RepID=A0ABT1PR17_9ACTN|nr:peptidase C39 family protein [Streptomyces humicola]MCQ4080109.1 peptidase C39 family protein [Streptomyces humicola]
MTPPAARRTVLAAALATATTAVGVNAAQASADPRAGTAADAGTNAGTGTDTDTDTDRDSAPVDYHSWTSHSDWRLGIHDGTGPVRGDRPGIVLDRPAGTTEYTDPHTGRTETWEYATWTSPVRSVSFGATELVASWNVCTPESTWIQAELCGEYNDGSPTPWYVMGRWTSGDGDRDIRRTSVDGQGDGRSAISTDTFAIDDAASGLRLRSYRLRLTLFRRPGTRLTPVVWRIGAMASAIPDRFTVPASRPGEASGVELGVPRYSQELHKGQYPEYDNGGEAWCSPTSSEMVIEYWGRKPTPAQLAWVDPSYADPQVDQAARLTYDYQYQGCGNWPFNAAYAATYHGMESVITRLHSLHDVEHLIKHGVPVITSQSFLASELDGAGYGTAGHLMCVIGFTRDGDVIANDPASRDDAAVRRVYKRHEFETIWLRTKRYDAKGKVASGSGGVVYVYWPTDATPEQRRALREVGIR